MVLVMLCQCDICNYGRSHTSVQTLIRFKFSMDYLTINHVASNLHFYPASYLCYQKIKFTQLDFSYIIHASRLSCFFVNVLVQWNIIIKAGLLTLDSNINNYVLYMCSPLCNAKFICRPRLQTMQVQCFVVHCLLFCYCYSLILCTSLLSSNLLQC